MVALMRCTRRSPSDITALPSPRLGRAEMEKALGEVLSLQQHLSRFMLDAVRNDPHNILGRL